MANIAEVSAQYAEPLVSAFDVWQPEILDKMFNKLGHQGQPWFLTLQHMGYLLPVAQRVYSHYEGELKNPPFKPRANVGAPGTNTNQLITLAVVDVDTSNQFYPRVGFQVWYPNGRKGIIMSIDVTTPSAPVLNIAPLGTSAAYALPAVTTATELTIQDSAFAEGTGQPIGIVPSATKISNNTQIFKDTISVTGSEQTNKTWFTGWQDVSKGAEGSDGVSAGKSWYNLNFADLEYRMALQISSALLNGIQDDGRNVDPVYGRRIYTTQGLVPSIIARGNIQTYTPGAFSITDFDAYSRIFDREYVGNFVGGLLSTNAYNEIKNAAVAYFANTRIDYESGQAMMGDMFGNPALGFGQGKKMNVDFELVKTGGRNFAFKRMMEFSDRQTFGTIGSVTNGYGVFVPFGQMKDTQSNQMVDNIGARYKSKDGYSRKMEIWTVAGAGPGMKVIPDDFSSTFMRAEIGSQTMGANQMILIKT